MKAWPPQKLPESAMYLDQLLLAEFINVAVHKFMIHNVHTRTYGDLFLP